LLQKKKREKRRKKKKVWCHWCEEKKKKRERKRSDDGVGRHGEKRKEREKKIERNIVNLVLCYFGVIFKLKLGCQLGIIYCKSWVLRPICIEDKFLFIIYTFKKVGALLMYLTIYMAASQGLVQLKSSYFFM
jgi:hypothetical protein